MFPVALLPVLNLVFIALYQNVLLMLITAPVYASWRHLGTPLRWVDALAVLCAGTCLVIEAVADQQQWNFQARDRMCGMDVY